MVLSGHLGSWKLSHERHGRRLRVKVKGAITRHVQERAGSDRIQETAETFCWAMKNGGVEKLTQFAITFEPPNRREAAGFSWLTPIGPFGCRCQPRAWRILTGSGCLRSGIVAS
jgi:hypothetical protein